MRLMNSRPAFVALIAGLLLIVVACADDPQPPSGTKATSASPSTTASAAGELIRYGKQGVTIENEGDIAKLRGAPEDFKTFIAGLVASMENDPECEYDPAYSVDAIDPAGYAAGGFGECGGHYTIWATVAGSWREVLAGQDHPMCDDLARLAIPKEILTGDAIGDTCYDADTKPVPYDP
jgi:hypothetical protein